MSTEEDVQQDAVDDVEIDEQRGFELLKRLSKRAGAPAHERIRLTAWDDEAEREVDVSQDGKFFLEFQDVDGVHKDAILASLRQERVLEEEVPGDAKAKRRRRRPTREVVERNYRLWPTVEEIVNRDMIVGGCLPVVQEGDHIQGWVWRETKEDNLAFLRGCEYGLYGWIVTTAMDFLLAEEPDQEVVEDLGN